MTSSSGSSGYQSVKLDDFAKVFGETSVEVSSVALGGRVISCSDEFFAEAKNLIKVEPSANLAGQFGPNGALYDGWETRRHNDTHDWVIVALGPSRCQISGFDIDTGHFTGNYGPEAKVYGLCLAETGEQLQKAEERLGDEEERWEEILPTVSLGPGSRHLFKIEPTNKAYSHVKLCMIPDGGFGRFRVYGTALPPAPTESRIDLAAALHGGRVVAQSDQFYGKAGNLLLPGRGHDMSDGWETKRSREKNHKEWAVIKLGERGYIDHLEIDTAYHMGNFPMRAEIHAIDSKENIPSENSKWTEIIPAFKTGPHRQHFMPASNAFGKLFTHIRLTIYPDGGLKRIRVMGYQAHTVPQSHKSQVFECLPLTYEAFAPYGRIVQGYSVPMAVPRGLAKTVANQGTACKIHKMAPLEHTYGKDGVANIDVVRAEAQVKTGTTIDIKVLERHPHTTQAFIPMGKAGQTTAGLATGASFIAIVALPGKDGEPDLSTLKAFLIPPNQGVSYGVGIWHHPLMTADATLDYALVETEWGKLVIPSIPTQPGKEVEKISQPSKGNSLTNGFKSVLGRLGANIPCKPLTAEAFAPFGNVVQAYPSAEQAPKGVKVSRNDQFKVTRFHDLAPVRSTYPEEANASLNISVFRATPKEGIQSGKPWPVHFLERHPYTEQAFLPMGLGEWAGKGEESLPGGAFYVVIVAKNGADDKPDLSSIQAFYCQTNQGVNYHAGVWHHPMLTVGGTIDLACVEAQISHKNDSRDCELLEFTEAVAVVDVPEM